MKNGDRNASSNITLANGDVVWVKVRNYHAAGVQTLEEATPRVKAKLIEKKAFDAAKKDIQATLDAFKTSLQRPFWPKRKSVLKMQAHSPVQMVC